MDENDTDSTFLKLENIPSPFESGRESLGILPPGFDQHLEGIFIDPTPENFELLGCPLLDGKESLGILPPDFGKNLVGILEPTLASVVDRWSFENLIQDDDGFGSFYNNIFNNAYITIPDTSVIVGKDSTANLLTCTSITSRRTHSEPTQRIQPSPTVIYSAKSPSKCPKEHKRLPTILINCDAVTDDSVFEGCQRKDQSLRQLYEDLSAEYESANLDATAQPDWPKDISTEIVCEDQPTHAFKIEDGTCTNEQIPVLQQTVLERHQHLTESAILNSLSPKKVLQMVSDFLDTLEVGNEQKAEGHTLVCRLSEILCNTKSRCRETSKCGVDDSGHSSKRNSNASDKDSHEVYEVLDLSRKSSDISPLNISPERPLDLSTVKKLNRSLSHPAVKTNANRLNTSTPATTDQVGNNTADVKIKVVEATSLVPKGPIKRNRSANGVNQKGPLKAVIPVEDMKRGPNATPEKYVPSTNPKKAKTPVQDPNMKPMAASTPCLEQHPTIKSSIPLFPSHKQDLNSKADQKKLTRKFSMESISSKQKMNSKTERIKSRYSLDDGLKHSKSTEKANSLQRRNSGDSNMYKFQIPKIKKANKENVPK